MSSVRKTRAKAQKRNVVLVDFSAMPKRRVNPCRNQGFYSGEDRNYVFRDYNYDAFGDFEITDYDLNAGWWKS